MKQQFTGSHFPKAVWEAFRDKRLSGTEVLLLLLIDTVDKGREGCIASNKEFGEVLGMDEHYISRVISKLVDMRLLERRVGRGNCRSLYALLTIRDVGRSHSTLSFKITPVILKDNDSTSKSTDRSFIRSSSTHSLTHSTQRTKREGFGLDSFEDKAANKLHEVILELFDIDKDHSGWARVFQEMMNKGITTERIKRVINWYRAHGRDKYIPHVEDAKQFREKFGALEKAVDRAAPVKVEITELDKQIVAKMEHLHWPKGSKAGLAEAVHKSLEAYEAWKRKRDHWWVPLKAKWPDPFTSPHVNFVGPRKLERLIQFDHHLFGTGFINTPRNFVQNWFEAINKKVQSWEDWSGDLTYYVFSEEHPDFQRAGRTASERYSRDAKLWDDYLKALNED